MPSSPPNRLGLRLILVALSEEENAMKTVKEEKGLVDLGDARVETKGADLEGQIDFQTGLKRVNGGIKTAD